MTVSTLRSLLPALLAALVAALPGTAAPSDAELTCERVPELMRAYLKQHIRVHTLGAEIRERTADTYIERLDPSKTLLLADDVDRLHGEVQQLFRDLQRKDCTRLDTLHAEMLGRYRGMQEYVRSVVKDDGYAIDAEASVVIDPDKRGFPKTSDDRRALYRRLIHFQMANYVAAGTALPEARDRLVHRYELMTRRMEEQDADDRYALFLDAFANSLDPHSNYLSADWYEDFQIGMELSLEGIGVALASRDGYSVVEKVIPGGATDRADALRPKDKIIAVAQENGEFVDVIDMALRDVVRLIRGERNTKVHLRVLRQEETTRQFTVTIVRDTINLEEQAASLRWETRERDGKTLKLAVIDLPSFYGHQDRSRRQSSDDVRMLLEQVKKEGADGVLLDLSRNGGGLLENAIEVAGLFIRKGAIVAVKDTYAQTRVLADPDPGLAYTGPLVVLTSRVSASASEIVAGAMKDYGRAVVVGDGQTFGKGSVQSVVHLPPGLGGIKVTTAIFFRPGGASTQRDGVASDVVLPPLFEFVDFGEAHQPHALATEHVDAFVSDGANHRSPERGWRAVDGSLLAELGRRSAERIRTDEDFAELEERLAKARERNGLVHVSDILDESRNGSDPGAPHADAGGPEGPADGPANPGPGDGGDTKSASNDDEERRGPHVREAVDILADYVALSPA